MSTVSMAMWKLHIMTIKSIQNSVTTDQVHVNIERVWFELEMRVIQYDLITSRWLCATYVARRRHSQCNRSRDSNKPRRAASPNTGTGVGSDFSRERCLNECTTVIFGNARPSSTRTYELQLVLVEHCSQRPIYTKQSMLTQLTVSLDVRPVQ